MSTLDRVIADVQAEYARARLHNGGYNSHHEVYGVLSEEVAEYFEQVRRRPDQRDIDVVYGELVQIAQVAIAAAVQVWEAAGSIPQVPAEASEKGGAAG